ncbi:reverse transcriptase domain-containing protein [Tanacetum coccineum]
MVKKVVLVCRLSLVFRQHGWILFDWKGDVAFKYRFPRVYALESNKNVMVAEKLASENLGCSLRRIPRDGTENSQFLELVAILNGFQLLVMQDRCLDGLPTRPNLSRKGSDIQSIMCPICGIEAESTNHIFFACSMAREFCRMIVSWWDVDFLELSSYEEWADWVSNLRIPSKRKVLLEGRKQSLKLIQGTLPEGIEDVEPEPNLPLQEIIIFDPDDQPMWESAKTVAPTPNSAIIQLDVDDNFVINSTHLNMIRENKFDGYMRADPHDHIREFLAICNMFRYGKTQSEAVKLMIFPLSLYDEAKFWFNELDEEFITSWEQMRKAFINRFFPPSLVQTEEHASKMSWARSDQRSYYSNILSRSRRTHSRNPGHNYWRNLLYKTPNQAFQFLEDKVLFKLDWSIKSKNEHHQKSVSFAVGSDSNTDNSRFIEKLKAMDSQIISLNEELQDIRNKYNELREGNASKNHQNDDTLMCERHEANHIQSEELNNDVRNDLEDFKRRIRSMRTVHWKLFARDDGKITGVLPNKESKTVNQEPQSKTDLEKSITKFLDGQRVTNIFFKNNVNDMI